MSVSQKQLGNLARHWGGVLLQAGRRTACFLRLRVEKAAWEEERRRAWEAIGREAVQSHGADGSTPPFSQLAAAEAALRELRKKEAALREKR